MLLIRVSALMTIPLLLVILVLDTVFHTRLQQAPRLVQRAPHRTEQTPSVAGQTATEPPPPSLLLPFHLAGAPPRVVADSIPVLVLMMIRREDNGGGDGDGTDYDAGEGVEDGIRGIRFFGVLLATLHLLGNNPVHFLRVRVLVVRGANVVVAASGVVTQEGGYLPLPE